MWISESYIHKITLSLSLSLYIYTGWWFGTWLLFSHILGMSSSQVTNSIIFQRGRAQPPTSIDIVVYIYNIIYIYTYYYKYIYIYILILVICIYSIIPKIWPEKPRSQGSLRSNWGWRRTRSPGRQWNGARPACWQGQCLTGTVRACQCSSYNHI